MSVSVFKVIESWVDFGSLRSMKSSSAEDRTNKNDDATLYLEESLATDTKNIQAISTQNAYSVS